MVLYILQLTSITNEGKQRWVDMDEAVIRRCLGPYAKKKHGRQRRKAGLLSLQENIAQQMERRTTRALQRVTGSSLNDTAV